MTMTFRKSVILLLTFLFYKYALSASLSASDQKKYKNLIEGQGLYSVDDDVEILTIDNFKSELYGQKHAWLIEFYNSWCGFCQRFAPSWKALASDIRGWKDVIRIGAIDCTNEDNSPICRDFEIMSYPTLRYFHENYQEGPKNQGEIIQKGDDVNSHRRLLLEYLIKEQNEGRAQLYPNLRPYNHPNLNYLFSEAPSGTQYVILIVAKENETTGPEVAMDFHAVKHISIRYTYPNNTDLIYKKLKLSKLPAMIVMSQDNSLQKFADGLKTRESMKMVIKDFLRPKNIDIPKEEAKTEIYTGKWQDAEVPDAESLFEAHQKKLLTDKIKKMKDPVFQMDLETALRWSLKREVARVKTIEGDKLKALHAYLNVVAKYFPFGLNGHKFIIQLRDYVANSNSIEGKEILSMIKEAERKDDKLFSSPEQWLACEGSSPEHRGYPCGLWKMFHYLTVNAAERNTDNPKANPLEVLRAMEGYIRNFFGCADCAQHFLEMVEKKDMKSVSSLDSSVLWLWMAHNAANKRLAGDETEDPQYPKIQFPKSENCPSCRNADNTWDFNEVLKYVKQVYSSINVRYIGSDTRVLHSALENPIAANSGGLFHKLDASMCFILYLASFILIVFLIHMFLKRGYRKKRYVHDILGKV